MFAHLVFLEVRCNENFQDAHIEGLDIGLKEQVQQNLKLNIEVVVIPFEFFKIA